MHSWKMPATGVRRMCKWGYDSLVTPETLHVEREGPASAPALSRSRISLNLVLRTEYQ
jgi:hypothetical protein